MFKTVITLISIVAVLLIIFACSGNLWQKRELKQRLLENFPESGGSDWGVKDVFNEENGIEIEYLLVPLWFSETFIIDH